MYRTEHGSRHGGTSVHYLAAAIAVLVIASVAGAQETVNNRDEVVNIVTGGSPEGGDEVLKIFRPETKTESLNYITKLIELQFAPADEVSEYVDAAVELEGGLSKTLKYKDPNTGKNREFIQVVTTLAQMPSILELINGLDLPEMVENSSDPDYEVRMRYRKASEVAEILSALEVEQVFFDDITNTLHFQDSESKLELLNFYDVPPLQVQFTIEIIEVREDDAGKVGLDWDAWKRGIEGGAQYVGGSHLSPRLDWMMGLDSTVLANFLNYTVQQGHAEVRQNVVLNINNGAVGQINHTRTIPTYGYEQTPSEADFARDTRRSAGTSLDVELTSGQARSDKVLVGENEEGLRITISPVIGTELVTIDLVIDSRTFDGYDAFDRPIMVSQTFESSITLKDRQSLHAATIERQTTVDSVRGIPGLKKIPGIGRLFSTKKKRVTSSKSFVIITPCYCESVSYEARLNGGPADILKFRDTELPEYIPRFSARTENILEFRDTDDSE